MKRKRSATKSKSKTTPSFDTQFQQLPNDLKSVIMSKLPVHDQKQVNKAHYELQRLRAAIFYDFFKLLVAQSQNNKEDFKVNFFNSDANTAYEYKKISFVTSRTVSSRSSSDKKGEYTLNIRTIDKANVPFYANSTAEHVMVATSVWCTANVYPIVASFAEKLYPGLKVKVIR